MGIQMWVESGTRFSLDDLKEALPHSRAVKQVEDLESEVNALKSKAEYERKLKSVLDGLESCRGMKENWDSYGAAPISDAAVDAGKKLARVLLSEELCLCPTVDGGVALFYGPESFSVVIDDAGRLDRTVWGRDDEDLYDYAVFDEKESS